MALENVSDPVFSSGAMGRGLALKPSSNAVYSPVDGSVEVAFETGHAFAIKSVSGAEVLIHVGIDTVSMAGDGFESKVTVNQEVKKGDLLGYFDSAKIAAAGLDDTTMVIVTNSIDYSEITLLADGIISQSKEILRVK